MIKLRDYWYRFVRWLWFGSELVPECPQYRMLKVRGVLPKLAERFDDKILFNIKFIQPWTYLKTRFFRHWLMRKAQRYYHFSDAWAETHWRGTPSWKCPNDLLIYQEILFENQPDVIIECGTAYGGTALFLADVCELLNHGLVASVDLAVNIEVAEPLKRDFHRIRPMHDRIMYCIGYSDTDPIVLDYLKQFIQADTSVMVILDSDHSSAHVKKQLELYAPLVTKGQYLIVEDTNVGWLIKPEQAPGPLEAVREFLSKHPEFYVDYSKERHMITMHPCGFLRRRGG